MFTPAKSCGRLAARSTRSCVGVSRVIGMSMASGWLADPKPEDIGNWPSVQPNAQTERGDAHRVGRSRSRHWVCITPTETA